MTHAFAGDPIFPDATEAKNAIDALSGTDLAAVETAMKTISSTILNYKKSVDGKSIKLTNQSTDSRGGRCLGYDNANSRAAAVASTGDDVIWTLKACEDGSFKMYNFVNNLYLGDPNFAATHVNEADAPSFNFIPTGDNVGALVCTNDNDNMVHVANHTNYKLISYYSLTDAASLWKIEATEIKVSREQYDLAVAAKATLPYAIQQAYGLVTDASNYYSNWKSDDEGSYEALLDNATDTYFHSAYTNEAQAETADAHYIQADLGEGKSIDEFYFYMVPRSGNGNNRPVNITVSGSNDNSAYTEIGQITTTLDATMNPYMSSKLGTDGTNYRYIRLTVTSTNSGTKFFTLSELYFFPADGDAGTLAEAYNNFAALSITETAVTDAATALINGEATLALANIKKEVAALLAANESNHASAPALGQYTTEGYNALNAAYAAADATQESLEAAIAAFEATKNVPVFTIDGVIGYAKGKSIYDDNDAAPNFKTTDVYDKTMWWALDMTTTTVGVTEEVGIYNVGTGNGFWGVNSIKVAETSDAVEGEDDGIFLFYTTGNGTPLHFQDNGQVMVRYSSEDAIKSTGGSAAKFTYIGNSYDLRKYDDEYVAACTKLIDAVNAKSYWLELFGDGIGQYGGDQDTFLAPLTHGIDLLNVAIKALLENYEATDVAAAADAINAMPVVPDATTYPINQPVEGKYYRIKGANDNAAYYLTGNLTSDGAKTALQETADAATIFRYIGGKLLAVESNLYIGMISNFYPFQVPAEKAPAITFAASSRKAGAYTVESDRFFHYNSNNTIGAFLDRCTSDPTDHTAHDWYLEEVSDEDVPANTNLLTDITNLSAEASYRIYGERGFIYVVDDGNMKGTNSANVAYNPNNDKHHFAIVTIGENKYLYNVGAEKFVMKSGNTVALTDYPEHALTIEPAADLSTDYDWVLKVNGDQRIELSNAGTFGVYTQNGANQDAGSRWAIYKVGTFDPAEAQSMKKVTVNYTIDGVASTETVGVAAGSTLDFSYDFATVTSCTVGGEAQTVTDGACSVTIEDNVTISVAMTSDARLYRLKNTASSLYMTIVTPEAAAGVQIKDKADDAVKQAFRIVIANWQGKYHIKSTEGYFMASSNGGWDYGAYQTTTNEAGRPHDVVSLGEGKYGLKTLNGFAAPNAGAIADGSPLYSNHGANNSGREWEFEELSKSSITYIYKWDDQTITSEVHENVYEGLAAPATAVTLPFGFSYEASQLPTIKGSGNEEVEIACTLDLPFEYADSYENIETNGYWYYLKFDSDNNYYLYHTAEQNYIALDSKEIDKKNKDVYSWAFVGDPINGFKIVNKAAGNTMILSSSTTMAGTTGDGTWPIMTTTPVPEGNNTYWIPTASTHAEDGFFLAQKDNPANRMNNRGSKLAYWTAGAAGGSTFVVEARPFGPAAELEDLLIEAKELQTVVAANTGDKIGEYSETTATALTDAITTAEGIGEPTADDVKALEDVVLATEVILPTSGKYYQIHSALFAETKAVYSNGNAPMWKDLNAYDRSFYWLAVETADGGIALQNAQDNRYMNGASNQSGAWTASETPSAIDVKILTKVEHDKGYQYGIILNNWQLHANGHNNGNGTSGSIVSYNADQNSASAWYIVETELPSFFPVTYKFNYEDETKYTQETLVAVGGAYPEMNVFLPYGVTSNFALPTGTVEAASEHVFELTINKELPFEAVADGNTPNKWYYAQMHADSRYTAYVGNDDGLTWYGNTSVEDEDVDSYQWGFVGDLWTGYKMINKATGLALHSTGSGDATLVEASSATKFILSNSQIQDGEWFCLKYPDNTNYLNANAGDGHQKIEHWNDNDHGSSIFLTESDKTYTLNMAEIGYATFYSQYRVAIPEGVQAWVVSSIENNEVALEEVNGDILPAYTGVILTGEGSPSIVTSAAATAKVGTNLLRGTVTKTLIEAAANTSYYVLANGVNGVKLYKAKVNRGSNGEEGGNTHFYNQANKVYLPVATPVVEENGEPAQALSFRFRGKEHGTTEIEHSEFNIQNSEFIYDLQGRRVLNPTKGMYIVNGKKVLF